jgi:hypothetical protein
MAIRIDMLLASAETISAGKTPVPCQCLLAGGISKAKRDSYEKHLPLPRFELILPDGRFFGHVRAFLKRSKPTCSSSIDYPSMQTRIRIKRLRRGLLRSHLTFGDPVLSFVIVGATLRKSSSLQIAERDIGCKQFLRVASSLQRSESMSGIRILKQ